VCPCSCLCPSFGQVVGSQVAGSQVVGSQVVGSQVVGSQVVGSQMVDSQVVDSQVVGPIVLVGTAFIDRVSKTQPAVEISFFDFGNAL
jgi:hypothetical protein